MNKLKYRAWVDNGYIKEMHYANEIQMNSADAWGLWYSLGFENAYPEKHNIEQWQKDIKWMNFAFQNDFAGKDIYVGDLLSDRWKVEVYQNDEGTFMVKFHTNPNRNKARSLKKYLYQREKAGTSVCEGYRDCIVIGNIYENPEILSERS